MSDLIIFYPNTDNIFTFILENLASKTIKLIKFLIYDLTLLLIIRNLSKIFFTNIIFIKDRGN